VPTPGGAAIWRHSTVRQIVTHPGYTGTAVAYRFRRSHGPGQRTHLHVRPVEEHVTLPEGTIPPLVDAHVAAAVAARLAYNKQTATRNNPDPEAFLLRAGFVACGYCGGSVAGCWHTTDRWRYPVYCVTHGDRAEPCPKISISARELDAAVWRKVEGLLTRPELVAHELERLRQNDPTARDLAAVDASLRAARQRVENLVPTLGLFSDPALAAPVVAEIERAQQHVRALERERDGILARRGTWEEAERRLDALEEWCRTVAANLGELTYQDKRDALLALGVHVTLYRADHEPHYQITASIPLELPEDTQPDGETARFVDTTP
jgi:site-specific DNA recombinase